MCLAHVPTGRRVAEMPDSAFDGVVWVKPGSRRTRVGGSHGQPPALVVAVAAAPAQGAANRAAIAALAEALDVRRRSVQIVSGQHAREKRIRIIEPSADLAQRWAQLLSTVV